MASLEEIRNERMKKRERLTAAGFPAYPARTGRTSAIGSLRADFAAAATRGPATIAGRIRAKRGQGALVFFDLDDGTGTLQCLLKKDELPADLFTLFVEAIDIGDFVEAAGPLFVTDRGEETLLTKDWRPLGKSLRAIPDNWYGLENVEERLRRPYLDFLTRPERKYLFEQKNQFWQTMRRFLAERDFLEVETPVLEPTAGGADARPFVTHHHALDHDLYLRISPELHLKRLLVGGFPKVFEIGRIFRNEGMSDEHLQDYTQLECYWAYADYEMMMGLIEDMVRATVIALFGSPKSAWRGEEIDWSGPWPRVDYFELLSRAWGVDAATLTVDDLYRLAEKYNVAVPTGLGRGRLLDYIYKKTVRPTLITPQFLIRPPVDVEPLAKRDPNNPDRVERFQILALGTELGKGFSELNDPDDQRARFEEQAQLREAGDEEAQMMDEDFVEALEYGLPPAAGFGLSERLFAVLMDKSVRETTLFPLVRPKD